MSDFWLTNPALSGYDTTNLTPRGLEVTDGPYKNAALTARWKRVGNALENDAMSPNERTERVESALSKDLPKEFRALVQELAQCVKNLDEGSPRSAVSDIFENHPTSPLANTLKLFLNSNLTRPMEASMILDCAVDNTIKKEMYSARNHMVEESMHARDRRELTADRYYTVLTRLDETMNGINVSKLRDDVMTNKTPPRATLVKKTGIDDGPLI